jgi:MFS family permease
MSSRLTILNQFGRLHHMAGDRATPRGPAPRATTALGARYWQFWVVSALSNAADGILKVALALVAIQLTRSPALIAGLSFALTLPWLLAALPAGALADRLDRRRAMLAANGMRASLVAVLVLVELLHANSIWVLYMAAFGVGLAETLHDTCGQSILPQIVPRDRLTRANAHLYGAEVVSNQFVGPSVAGFLGAVGAAWAFSTPVALWLVAAAILLSIHGTFRTQQRLGSSLTADIAEGLRFLWRHRLLRTLAVMTGVYNLASNSMLAIFPLFAVGPDSAMRLSGPAYGLLMATIAVGSVIGSLVAEFIQRVLGRAPTLILTILTGALLLSSPALSQDPFVIGGIFLLGGIGAVLWNVIAVSLRQRVTPAGLLGRVNSAYRLVSWGTMPLGSVVGGLVAQLLGLPAVFLIMGILTLSLLSGMIIVTDRTISAAEKASNLD